MKFENSNTNPTSSDSSSSISAAINAFEKKHFSHFIGTDEHYRGVVLKHEMNDALGDHDLAEKMMLIDILKEISHKDSSSMLQSLQEMLSQFGETEVKNYLGLMSYASGLLVKQFIEEMQSDPGIHALNQIKKLISALNDFLETGSEIDIVEAMKISLPCKNALEVFEERFFSRWKTSNDFFKNMKKEAADAGIPEKAIDALIQHKLIEDIPEEHRDLMTNELGFIVDVYGVDEVRENLGCVSYALGLVVKTFLELCSKEKN